VTKWADSSFVINVLVPLAAPVGIGEAAGTPVAKAPQQVGGDADTGRLNFVVFVEAGSGHACPTAAAAVDSSDSSISALHAGKGADIDERQIGHDDDVGETGHLFGQRIQVTGTGVDTKGRLDIECQLYPRHVAGDADSGREKRPQIGDARAVDLPNVVGQCFLPREPRHDGPTAAGRCRQAVRQLQLVLQILRVRRRQFGALRHPAGVEQGKGRRGAGSCQQKQCAQAQSAGAPRIGARR
jgi:hypothetical protein